MKEKLTEKILELMDVMNEVGLDEITLCPKKYDFYFIKATPTVETHAFNTVKFYNVFKPKEISVKDAKNIPNFSYYETSLGGFYWQGSAYDELRDTINEMIRIDKLIEENKGEKNV